VRVLPPALRSVSPRELSQRIDAERRGLPLILHLDDEGRQRIVELGDRASVSVGRSPSSDVSLPWDHEVSRLHAVLACEGGEWTIADDGLSRNGSFVNGQTVLPIVGYQERGELATDQDRKKFGLPPKERMRDRDDPAGLAENGLPAERLSSVSSESSRKRLQARSTRSTPWTPVSRPTPWTPVSRPTPRSRRP